MVERPSDWNPIGEAAGRDPMAEQARLRSQCPVAWSDSIGGGFWAITRYEDIAKAAANTAVFSNTGNTRFGERPSPPIEVDRPEHTVYRRLLQPYFRPEPVARLEPVVRQLATGLLSPLVDAGRADLTESFTYPLPARVMCELLGIPYDDADMLKAWAEEVFQAMEERDNDPVKRDAAEKRLADYATDLVAKRKALNLDPDQDLVTGLIQKEVEGRRMTSDEILGMIRLLLSAGHNSTTSSLGIVLLHIARDPEMQRTLRAQPELILSAVQEFLRHESPVMTTKRLALEDVEVGGRQIAAGEQVFLVWSSGNRDDAHFENPDEIRLDRDANQNLTFGRGVHRCLGSPIALMELRTAVEVLFELTAWFELDGEVVRSNWERFGVTSLPVKFTKYAE